VFKIKQQEDVFFAFRAKYVKRALRRKGRDKLNEFQLCTFPATKRLGNDAVATPLRGSAGAMPPNDRPAKATEFKRTRLSEV